MKDSPIVILDEPTSALDPIAEFQILSEYEKIAKDKTTLLVSHRIGSAKLADKIMVMDKGRLIEMGTHEELYKLRGKYYELYQEQSKWYFQKEVKV